MNGADEETDQSFIIVEPTQGGWGATSNHDGNSAQFCFGNGETFNVPVEIAETRYGILIDEFSLNVDDQGAGAGEYVGGKGIVRTYRSLFDGQSVNGTFGRHLFKPWGTEGGHDGSSNNYYIYRADGEVEGPFGMHPHTTMNKDDAVSFVTGTGGGYGDPLKRDPEKVAKDVRNGFYTAEQAENLFGVAVDPDSFDYQELAIRKKA